MKNDVVIIELDRPRELRYGHKALKTLSALTGKTLDELETDDGFDLEQLEKFLYCGLLSDARKNGETLTLEQMEDLLDEAPSFNYLTDKMTEAMSKSFGVTEGNLPAPNQAAQPKAQRGTGKKA